MNYVELWRTNYVKVKDLQAFREWVDTLSPSPFISHQVQESEDPKVPIDPVLGGMRVALLGEEGAPYGKWNPETEDVDEEQLDTPEHFRSVASIAKFVLLQPKS